jgi:hypothetical protein
MIIQKNDVMKRFKNIDWNKGAIFTLGVRKSNVLAEQLSHGISVQKDIALEFFMNFQDLISRLEFQCISETHKGEPLLTNGRDISIHDIVEHTHLRRLKFLQNGLRICGKKGIYMTTLFCLLIFI